MVGIRFTEVLQERLQTEPIHTGQVEAEAIPVGGIERRVEVGPLAGAPHVPFDQSEVRLVEGQDLSSLPEEKCL